MHTANLAMGNVVVNGVSQQSVSNFQQERGIWCFPPGSTCFVQLLVHQSVHAALASFAACHAGSSAGMVVLALVVGKDLHVSVMRHLSLIILLYHDKSAMYYE